MEENGDIVIALEEVTNYRNCKLLGKECTYGTEIIAGAECWAPVEREISISPYSTFHKYSMGGSPSSMKLLF